MKKKCFVAILITLVMIISMLPMNALAETPTTETLTSETPTLTTFADTITVDYVDANGETQIASNVTEITEGGEYGSGWYILKDFYRLEQITFTGETHLILAEGAYVRINSGILLSNADASLTIYVQSTGNDMNLTVIGGRNAAGIGSGYSGTCGDITINGGVITVTGGYYGAGIGSGYSGTCGNITINSGTVTVNGGQDSAGIGSGMKGYCGNITINGGTVTATSGYDRYAIGFGRGQGPGTCGDITINGSPTIKAGNDAGSAEIIYGYRKERYRYVSVTYTPGMGPVPPAVHTHQGTPKTATTLAGKTVTYYGCDCGKIFEDADCTIEITDLSAWLAKDGSENPQTGTTNHRMYGIFLMFAFALGLALYMVKKCGKEY